MQAMKCKQFEKMYFQIKKYNIKKELHITDIYWVMIFTKTILLEIWWLKRSTTEFIIYHFHLLLCQK